MRPSATPQDRPRRRLSPPPGLDQLCDRRRSIDRLPNLLPRLGIGGGGRTGSPIGCDPVRPPSPRFAGRINPDLSGSIRFDPPLQSGPRAVVNLDLRQGLVTTVNTNQGCSDCAGAGTTSDQTSSAVSRHWRIRLRSIRASSRTPRLRIPCCRAFLALAIFPRSVFGPHDRSHGFQFRMSAACRARRSDVQPLLMAQLQ
jgi:hypothetical protein